MVTQAGGLFEDQNLNVHYNGVPVGGKTNDVSKGRLGGRKAPNDTSNSGKPSAFQAWKKHNTKNMICFGEDTGVSKSIFSLGGKANVSRKIKPESPARRYLEMEETCELLIEDQYPQCRRKTELPSIMTPELPKHY